LWEKQNKTRFDRRGLWSNWRGEVLRSFQTARDISRVKITGGTQGYSERRLWWKQLKAKSKKDEGEVRRGLGLREFLGGDCIG